MPLTVKKYLKNTKRKEKMNNYSYYDKILIEFVQKEINKGKTKIVIPEYLIRNPSNKVLVEIKRLCKLNNVEITIK